MAREGYCGFKAQLVKTKYGPCIFCWSPVPGPEHLSKYETICDDMMASATESTDDWLYWYECRMDEHQLNTLLQEGGAE